MNYNDICNTPNHAGIYCIRNIVNNKCYIGKAIKLRSSLKQHWNAIQSNSIDIYKAINKYGLDKFELSVLYEIRDSLAYNTRKRLAQLEKEFIEKYDSYNNGYNSNLLEATTYEMSAEQKEKIKSNALSQDEVLNTKNSNGWIKGKNLRTKEVFIFKGIKEVVAALEIPEFNIKKCLNREYHITNKYWQFCYYAEEFEDLPEYGSEDFEELNAEWLKALSNKKEICDYIKANPYCLYAEIKQQFTLSKKDFYAYKEVLGLTSKSQEVNKEEFIEFMKEHSKEECIHHFHIKERQFYMYQKKYLTL